MSFLSFSHNHDRQEGPRAPHDFGIWSKNPGHPGRLLATLYNSGCRYRITVEADPASETINLFRLERIREPASMGKVSVWPDFSVDYLSPGLSQGIMPLLFGNGTEETNGKPSSVFKAAECLLLSGELDQQACRPEVIRFRLQRNKYQSVVRSIAHKKELSAEVGKAIIDGLNKEDNPVMIQALSRHIVKQIKCFPEADRPLLIQRLIDRLVAVQHPGVLARMCSRLLPLSPGRDGLGDALRLTQRGATIRRPKKKKSEPEPLLLDYAAEINLKTAQVLIDTIIEHGGPLRSNRYGYYETGEDTLQHLVNNIDKVRDEDRPEAVYYLSQQLVLNGMSELGLRLLQQSNLGDDPKERQLLQGLSPALAFALIDSQEHWQLHSVIKNLDLFQGLDLAAYANHLVEVGKGDAVFEYLYMFKGLSAALAKKMVAHGQGANVLQHRDSFSLTRQDEISLVGAVLERGEIQAVLEGDISEKILEILEPQYHFLSFRKEIGLPCPGIYKPYLKLKRRQDRRLPEFIKEMRKLIGQAVSSEPQASKFIKSPYYREIVEAAYPLHAEFQTSYESNECCLDRSSDLKKFNIRPVYEIDLLEGMPMVITPGKRRDEGSLKHVRQPIKAVEGACFKVGYKQDKMYEIFDEEVKRSAEDLPGSLQSREEKLLGLHLWSLLGHIEQDELKRLLIGYQFAGDQGIQDYIQGTQDRSRRAQTPEYAHLLELREYYADTLNDTLQALTAAASDSVKKVFVHFYQDVRKHLEESRIEDLINRRRPDRLGLTPAFLKQIKRMQSSANPRERQAVAQRIAAEKRKIAAFITELTGELVEESRIDLRHFDAQQLIAGIRGRHARQHSAPVGSVEAIGWLLERFSRVFSEEIEILDREIGKYQPETEGVRQAKRLEAYITKNHSSAHARGVGGVCVAGDNPEKAGGREPCQWNLPNYFQLVLRDPETKRCEGLALLHYYQEQGKKVLTASFNPTSTYLYKVDQKALFHGMLGALAEFARDNDIDLIGCSSSTTVRTNRTGGQFELAMKEVIREVGEQFKFRKEQIFSVKHEVKQQTIDVLWKRSK